jgi:hypothetical protein
VSHGSLAEEKRTRGGKLGLDGSRRFLKEATEWSSDEGGDMGAVPRGGRSWGRVWGASVAGGTGPEPACPSGRRAPTQNRGGGVAAR